MRRRLCRALLHIPTLVLLHHEHALLRIAVPARRHARLVDRERAVVATALFRARGGRVDAEESGVLRRVARSALQNVTEGERRETGCGRNGVEGEVARGVRSVLRSGRFGREEARCRWQSFDGRRGVLVRLLVLDLYKRVVLRGCIVEEAFVLASRILDRPLLLLPLLDKVRSATRPPLAPGRLSSLLPGPDVPCNLPEQDRTWLAALAGGASFPVRSSSLHSCVVGGLRGRGVVLHVVRLVRAVLLLGPLLGRRVNNCEKSTHARRSEQRSVPVDVLRGVPRAAPSIRTSSLSSPLSSMRFLAAVSRGVAF